MDQTTICNMALSLAGTRSTIANLAEQSAEAIALNVWYNQTVTDVLRSAHWNFARKQVPLALLQALPVNPGAIYPGPPPALPSNVPVPWTYEYAYPSDCARLRYLLPQFQSTPGNLPGIPTTPDFIGPPVRFLVHNDDAIPGNPPGQDTLVILTNQTAAFAVYTKIVTNTQIWDPDFTNAFAHILASRTCYALKGDKALVKSLFERGQMISKDAQRTNGNENLVVQDVAPDWMKVRGFASDWSFPDGGFYFFGPQAMTLVM